VLCDVVWNNKKKKKKKKRNVKIQKKQCRRSVQINVPVFGSFFEPEESIEGT
jgi:hypothetical protein